jgi:hypothetical protein
MITITYTQTLIDWIINIYPENKKLHELAESGDESIGDILKAGIPKDPTINEIADIKTVEGLLELRSSAIKAKRKTKLYEMWITEVHAAYLKESKLKPREIKSIFQLVVDGDVYEDTEGITLIKI